MMPMPLSSEFIAPNPPMRPKKVPRSLAYIAPSAYEVDRTADGRCRICGCVVHATVLRHSSERGIAHHSCYRESERARAGELLAEAKASDAV